MPCLRFLLSCGDSVFHCHKKVDRSDRFLPQKWGWAPIRWFASRGNYMVVLGFGFQYIMAYYIGDVSWRELLGGFQFHQCEAQCNQWPSSIALGHWLHCDKWLAWLSQCSQWPSAVVVVLDHWLCCYKWLAWFTILLSFSNCFHMIAAFTGKGCAILGLRGPKKSLYMSSFLLCEYYLQAIALKKTLANLPIWCLPLQVIEGAQQVRYSTQFTSICQVLLLPVGNVCVVDLFTFFLCFAVSSVGKHSPMSLTLTLTLTLGWCLMPLHVNGGRQSSGTTSRGKGAFLWWLIGPAVRADFRHLYPANAKTPMCCPSDDNRTKVTNSVTSARSLWWHVGPYFWPVDLTRTANPI